ncbi:hypothetical protein RclHR1_02940017 [Rhizophagus clarus]|uniref:Uncharacterized protein n=1 Tax=Rhizophagus clarus TaxID=94130 RepID=A0A2Z6R558_9GLOM|nr:hypothetical protein RclHR1_02940017 [Rhizophagus clarus]
MPKPGTISTCHVTFNLKKLGKKLIPPINTKVVHQENCGHRLHSKSRTLNIWVQTLFQRSETSIQSRPKSETSFRGGSLSRVTIFEGHLKTKLRLFEDLGCSISKVRLYLKSRVQADWNISKTRTS